MSTEEKLARLWERCAEIEDLGNASALLSWDQEVLMPPKGAAARSKQLAALAGIRHERLTDAEVGTLLGECEAEASDDETHAALAAVRRSYDRATKLPRELVQELARAQSEAMQYWKDARAQADFSRFAPSLGRLLKLAKEKAACLGGDGPAYDALLDVYERDATESAIAPLFEGLRERLVPLLDRVLAKSDAVDPACVLGGFEKDAQARFGRFVVERLGFDLEGGRIDESIHPFCSGMGRGDTRLTRRFDDDLRGALYGLIHEAGHGLYEQGLPERWDRHPLGDSVSLGIHESQSRLWENIVARGRPFWEHFLPALREHFPGRFDTTDVETLYRAVNQVQRSFIRVEADEVTYNLHVILRFEVERRLFAGELELNDIPTYWNDTFEQLLGIRPQNDADGCLQDIHWSLGAFGYFPTYTLGTLYASQLETAARRQHPDLDEHLATGNFQPLLEWLREQVHRVGKRYGPHELIERATGNPPSPEPFLAYLEAKMVDVYGI